MNDEVDVPSVEDAVSVLISLSDDRAGVEGYLTAELLSELNYEELFTTLVTRFQAGTVPVWLLSNVASAVIKAACDAQLDLSAKRAVLQSLLTAVILACPPLLRDDDLETFEKRVCSGDGEALTFDFYKFVAAAANATLIVPEMTLKEKCGITYRSLGILTRRMREGEGLSAADQWAILEAINVTKDSCPHGNVFREETLAVLRTLSSASPAAHDNIVTWNACRSALRGNMRALAESSKSESGAVVPGSSFAASSRKTSLFTPSPSRQGSSSGSGFSSRFSLWPSSSSSSSSSAKAATTSAGSGSAAGAEAGAGAEAESPREQSAGGRVLKSEAPSDDSPLLTGGATLGSVREHEQEDEDEPDAEAEPEAEAVAEAKAEAEAAEEEDEEEAAVLVKTKSRSKSKGRSKKKGHISPSANGAARASAQDEDEDAAREEGEKEASTAAHHQHQQQQNHHQAPSPSLLSSRLSPATSPSTAPASPEPAAAAASPAPGKNKGKSLSFSFGSFIRPSSSSSSSSSAAPAPTATTVAAAASSSPKLSSPSFSSSPSPLKARAVSPTEIASASTSSDVDVLRAAVTSLTEECAALKAALASQLMQTHRVKGEYTKRALEVSELQTRIEVIELQTEVDNAERLLGKEKAILLREAFATTTTPSDEDEGKPKKGGGQGSKKGQGGSSSSSSSPRSSSPHTVPANTLTIKNSATGSVLASAGASEGAGGKRTLSPLRNGGPAKPTRPKSAARSRARSSSPKPRAKTAAADGGARASAAADKKDSKGGKAAAAGTDGKVPHKPETPKKSGASPRPNTTSGSSSKSARK